ncbi:SAV_6107 family HEPN domain-containing protein [Rhodococcus spongiicola]|uniref:SAV_6107 family HEPN domain-containing protein n=1 Tax=Rhodococcus spongiicola TaxID=2487352 RepID=UPI001EEA43BD|nr:SAV_6107 family HEPN domain-containing protein [Rhodococcus spongiicola]
MSVRATTLLRRADGLLSEAVAAGEAGERFRCSYLGALKGAAAVLAGVDRNVGSAGSRRPRSRSAWVLMARAVPELADWAGYFADHSTLRASIEAGVAQTVSDADADHFYLEVGRFLTAVEDFLAEPGRKGDLPGFAVRHPRGDSGHAGAAVNGDIRDNH